jgi:hypothetical protein
MKLHLESFICDFGVNTEMVAKISTPALDSFLCEHNIMWTDFNPDFINDELNRFIFCTQNKEWAEFVEKFYRLSGVKIVLQEIQTPKDFDIINYYSCNNKVIRYIIFPELRDETFLEQNQRAISDAYLLAKVRNVLANPKESGINSLNKLKLYWNKITFFEDESPIVTRRQHALKLISKHFSFIYCWLYDNFVRDTKKLSASFKTDYFKSSDILWKRLIDACDRAEQCDDYLETELPF